MNKYNYYSRSFPGKINTSKTVDFFNNKICRKLNKKKKENQDIDSFFFRILLIH